MRCMTEGRRSKVLILVEEAIDSYILGHFHATVALCAMAAERFLYDFVDFADIKIQDKTLNDKQKEYLYKLSSRNLIDFSCEIGTINDKTKVCYIKSRISETNRFILRRWKAVPMMQ
jgi:hypothetical protein